jgi:hypothetical protein
MAMSALFALLFFACFLTLIGSLIGIFFRKIRRKAKLIALASFVGMLFSYSMAIKYIDDDARQQGFLDAADMRRAKELGIADPAAWQSRREQLAKQAEEARLNEAKQAESEAKQAEDAHLNEAKQAEEARRKKEEACEKDLQCIGNEKLIEATFACRPWVERMATNDFQWTDQWYESKFERFRWQDRNNGVVTYVGDKVKFQNAFGAWTRSIYECDYNFRTKFVANVRVRAGQFPPD